MTSSSSLTQISHLIAQINQEKPNTVRQRLKEWYQEAPAKKGLHRRQLDVSIAIRSESQDITTLCIARLLV